MEKATKWQSPKTKQHPTPTTTPQILPQSVELEKYILGVILNDKMAYVAISAVLRPEHFYKESHQKIYDAIRVLFDKGENIDIMTMVLALRKSNELDLVGGTSYLVELTQNSSGIVNVESQARILIQFYIRRESIKISNNSVSTCYDDSQDVFELIEKTTTDLGELVQKAVSGKQETVRTITDELASKMGTYNASNDIATGFTFIDSIMKIQKGRSALVYIGARPSVGKSALISTMSKKMAKNGVKVGFVSLEMAATEIVERMVVEELGPPYQNPLEIDKITHHKNAVQVQNALCQIRDLPILFHDDVTDVATLVAVVSAWKIQKGIDILFVDFLQKLADSEDPQSVTAASNALQKMSKRLKMPIICLSSFSRNTEKNGDGKPSMSDFRASGGIESDADVAILLWRPERYDVNDVKVEGQIYDTHNLMVFDFAKNRNGKVGKTVCQLDLSCNRFYDYGHLPQASPAYQQSQTQLLNTAFREVNF